MAVEKVEGDGQLADNGKVSVRHSEATWGDREPYGPSGFKGLFANYYVSLCAAFAAVSMSSKSMNPISSGDVHGSGVDTLQTLPIAFSPTLKE